MKVSIDSLYRKAEINAHSLFCLFLYEYTGYYLGTLKNVLTVKF